MIGVEFVTPAITSTGPTGDDKAFAELMQDTFQKLMPHVRYVDLYHRGYCLLDITHERTQAEWYHMETVLQRTTKQRLAKTFTTEAGNNYLRPATHASIAKAAAAPAPAFKSLFRR